MHANDIEVVLDNTVFPMNLNRIVSIHGHANFLELSILSLVFHSLDKLIVIIHKSKFKNPLYIYIYI